MPRSPRLERPYTSTPGGDRKRLRGSVRLPSLPQRPSGDVTPPPRARTHKKKHTHTRRSPPHTKKERECSSTTAEQGSSRHLTAALKTRNSDNTHQQQQQYSFYPCDPSLSYIFFSGLHARFLLYVFFFFYPCPFCSFLS